VSQHVSVCGQRTKEDDRGRLTGGASPASAPTSASGFNGAAVDSGDVTVRRRITGKRKIVHVETRQGDRRPSVPEEFGGPAFRRKWDNREEWAPPEGASVGAHAGGLGTGEEGLAESQAVVVDRGARAPRPRGWTGGEAPSVAGELPSYGTLPARADPYGEKNTLKSTSFTSSAAAGPGACPTSRASGAAAATHPPLGVG
jgi:hypothetical protein